MRSRSGTYQQILTQVPIRPLIRGAVIVQDINPVSPSDGMKIFLQQGVGISTFFKKGPHMTTLFLEIRVFRTKTAKSLESTARETCFAVTRVWGLIMKGGVGVGFLVLNRSADVIINNA